MLPMSIGLADAATRKITSAAMTATAQDEFARDLKVN
jgi:hypothetical protein